MRKDDSTLEPEDQAAVRKHAALLLRKADAVGVFPTPIHRIVEAAELEIARESALDRVFLKGFYRSLPNSLKLAPDMIKRGAEKLMGLIDIGGATIHVDDTLYPTRKDFVILHETGHGFLPWQRDTYKIMEDSKCELDPYTKDQFERQANNFASDVFFQLDSFSLDAADCEFSLMTPVKLARRYGASLYASIRRFVSGNERPCAAIVFNPPVVGRDEVVTMSVRRIVSSPSFRAAFGDLPLASKHGPESVFVQNLPDNRYRPPVPVPITHQGGESYTVMVEAFNTSRQVFFLVYPESIVANV